MERERQRRTAFSMSAGHSWSCCLVEANMGRPVEATGSRSSKSVAQRDVSKAPCKLVEGLSAPSCERGEEVSAGSRRRLRMASDDAPVSMCR